MRRGVLLCALLVPSLARAEGRKMTVDDVVRVAIGTHPRLSAARSRAEGAHHLQASAGARMLPVIVVTEEYQHWDKPFAIAFDAPGAPAGSAPLITAREQDTNTLAVAASQPIVGLLRRVQDYKSEARSAEAADAQVRTAEAATREALEIEYLRMFEAAAMEQIAKTSEGELGEQVTVSAAQVKAGTLNDVDLLRVKVAQANARQQAIMAHVDATGSRAALLSAIDAPPDDTSIEFVEPISLLGAPAPVDANRSAEGAVGARPEMAQARLAAEAADHRARARLYGLLPEVSVEGAYTRIDGQAFAPKNAAFVGVKAEWPIWEWGASFQARQAASAQADAARADVETQRRQVLLEVTTRESQLEARGSAVGLAEQTIASAAEAYRVTDARVRAGAATITDLLDAQAALTQARLNLARANYERAMARVQLARALGKD
jgi:outer membrane protein TolC